MSLIQHVGLQIRELRQTCGGGGGISQEQLAAEIGTTANTISRWESAIYKPGLEDLERIARYFKVPLASFFPGETPVAQEPMQALLRAAQGLENDDLEELRRYAEFRRLLAAQSEITRRSTRKKQKPE